MDARRLIAKVSLWLCGVGGMLVLWAAPALAVRTHILAGSFGSAGSGEGQLSSPAGVAVNESSGDVYVADRGNNRVEYFAANGTFQGQFDGSGSNLLVEGKAAPTGQLASPNGIAVDNDLGSPSHGDVYVVDSEHRVVDKFSATGEYIGQLTETTGGSSFPEIEGITVDSGGQLWVYQSNAQAANFSSAVANEYIASREVQVSFGVAIRGFTVDSHDNIYAASFFDGVVKFDSAGKRLISPFDTLLPEFFGVTLNVVAADLSSDEIYIGNADGGGSVGRFASNASVLETFGSEQLQSDEVGGIAIDATGHVYVADLAADVVYAYMLQPPAAPTVEAESVLSVTADSATLDGQIKPTGPATTYYFQFGTANCAGGTCTDVPAAPGAAVGSGFETQSVSVLLQGLAPATTYHYRVVAINELGTTDGPDRTFTTQATGTTFTQPDGRAWEMVTPPDKHGAGLIAVGNEQGADIQAALDGSGITFGTTAPIEAKPAGSNTPEVTQIISKRLTPGDWETLDIATPHEAPTEIAVGHSAEYKLFSEDLTLGMVEPQGHTPLPPLPPGSEKTVYLRHADGKYEALVTAANVPEGTKFGGNGEGAGTVHFITATPDGHHVVLSSSVDLTSTPAGSIGLYVWSAGQLDLASVLPSHEPASFAKLGNGGENVRNAISTDGTRLVWTDGSNVYLRDMARGETIEIGKEAHFTTADKTDSRIFFLSSAQLTEDSTATGGEPDLYEFALTSAQGEPLAGHLTDLSVDGNAGESADIRGVIGASDDGSDVYFVANGVLGDAAERGATPGQCERSNERFKQTCSLYVEHYDGASGTWEAPKLVATLSGGDYHTWVGDGFFANLKQATARVAPNGRYLAFMSERGLTGYDTHDANSGVPDEEVYIYDAARDSLGCVSCNPTGARPQGIQEGGAYEERLVDYAQNWGGRWMAANIPGWTTRDLSVALYQSRYLDSSGRLFFNSADAIVPADVNGVEDVYEYEPAGVGSCQPPGYGVSASSVHVEALNGCVALISAGTSAEESAFMDASEGGGDVFFLTLSRLASQDQDTSIDLYDAHECTPSSPCAALAPVVPPPCATGDACKPAPTPQPTSFGAPASATFAGVGNLTPEASNGVKHKSKSLTRAQRLARALKACRKKPKRKRAACESHARKRYGARRARVGKSLSTATKR